MPHISNMLHWLALHSDLEVVERHRHSFDPFPDSDRVVPFGTGATLLEGIFDLKLHNPTDVDYQVRLRLTPTNLVGQLRSAAEQPFRYEIVERDHRSMRDGADVYRANRIVRRRIPGRSVLALPGDRPQDEQGVDAAARSQGPGHAVNADVAEVTLFTNYCRVGYTVPDERLS